MIRRNYNRILWLIASLGTKKNSNFEEGPASDATKKHSRWIKALGITQTLKREWAAQLHCAVMMVPATSAEVGTIDA